MRRVLLPFVLAAALPAQALDQRAANVGMRARIQELVLPGSELEPAPNTPAAPIVLRVVGVYPHGEHFRYDLEWVGLEPGSHDLAAYLVRKDGSSTDGLPKLAVQVKSTLPKRRFEPSEPAPTAAPRLDGYSDLGLWLGIAWGTGLLLILFVGRRRRQRAPKPVAKPTLADRLRPLVAEIASGRGDAGQKAELERLLVAFWRSRLGLGDVKAGEAIVQIRRHPEAGALLQRIEAWLHMREPPQHVDVEQLLAPYRSVTADQFAPLPTAGNAPAEVR